MLENKNETKITYPKERTTGKNKTTTNTQRYCYQNYKTIDSSVKVKIEKHIKKKQREEVKSRNINKVNK